MGKRYPVWTSEQRRAANRGARFVNGELVKQSPSRLICGEWTADGDVCTKDPNHKGDC